MCVRCVCVCVYMRGLSRARALSFCGWLDMCMGKYFLSCVSVSVSVSVSVPVCLCRCLCLCLWFVCTRVLCLA